MDEWNSIWAWWSHEVWMELYFYDMLFEAAWFKYKRNRIMKEIDQHEKEEHE